MTNRTLSSVDESKTATNRVTVTSQLYFVFAGLSAEICIFIQTYFKIVTCSLLHVEDLSLIVLLI